MLNTDNLYDNKENSNDTYEEKPPHISVLPNEIKDLILKQKPQKAVDFTFGAGGHSRIILDNSNCSLIAFDRDASTKYFADKMQSIYKDRFQFYNDISANLHHHVKEKQDFIMGDLGLSQMQLASDRGFAYSKNSSLEMNMGVESLGTLKDVIKTLSEEDIYYILAEYGEEPQARKISKAIHMQRMWLDNSEDLKRVILNNIRNHQEENKVLSRCFQAFRIYINREIAVLEKTLTLAFDLLNPSGMLAIITFHSLEDRAVKIFFKQKFKNHSLILPKEEEIEANSQSRSAKLRVGIKQCN